MKRFFTILIAAAVLSIYSDLSAQSQTDTTKTKPQHGKNFVDLNGDGYNDNAPDHDGDGIPNGLDPDWKGPKFQYGKKAFVDLNGDGIDDNTGLAKARRGKGGYGPNKGTITPKNGQGTQNTAGQQSQNGRGKRAGRK